jgi:hypothetical protein
VQTTSFVTVYFNFLTTLRMESFLQRNIRNNGKGTEFLFYFLSVFSDFQFVPLLIYFLQRNTRNNGKGTEFLFYFLSVFSDFQFVPLLIYFFYNGTHGITERERKFCFTSCPFFLTFSLFRC